VLLKKKEIEENVTRWDDVIDTKYLEADAFTIFSYLMNSALPLYTGASRVQGGEGKQPLLALKVHKIHYELLKKFDPELYNHLENANVLPQLYLIRWLRVLFTREFTISQAIVIWDAIFQSKGMELADYLCVAMLSYIRTDLLSEDPTRCLIKVFHYPALDDQEVRELLQLARGLHDGTVFDFDKKESLTDVFLKRAGVSLANLSEKVSRSLVRVKAQMQKTSNERRSPTKQTQTESTTETTQTSEPTVSTSETDEDSAGDKVENVVSTTSSSTTSESTDTANQTIETNGSD